MRKPYISAFTPYYTDRLTGHMSRSFINENTFYEKAKEQETLVYDISIGSGSFCSFSCLLAARACSFCTSF